MSKDPLLQPFQLKHLSLRNRIISTAHEPAYSEDGLPKDRYRLYHVEKAKGGIALTMTAGSAIVAPDSPAAFGNLHAYKDEIVPWLARLADECHEHGAAVMIQITHLGRRTNWNHSDWLPVLAPSPVREPAHRSFPKEAEDWDLARIVRAYAAAAERMQAAGLDGIEIEAYGHLLDGFWSPATNRRNDAYGGSLENRLRFTFEVLAAIRAAVGSDFIVGLRMVVDEAWEPGLSRAEGLEIGRRLVGSGQVDFLNVIRGHIETDAALAEVIPIHGMPAAPHLDFAGEVRAALGVPVLHAARINDVATARHAIASGKLDLVGMTRAHIADPHIARKVAAGREHAIRPCVGATYCLDRIYEGHEALCIHNPATGREATMPHEVARARRAPAKKIVVVGAGPAGLEAARVAAARGHAVVLFEAADQPGGQIRLAARARRRAELLGIAEWRLAQCEEHGVELRFNHLADAADVLAEDPDVVIVATGGLPDAGFLAEARISSCRAGTSCRATPSPAPRSCCSTTTAPIPGCRRRSLWPRPARRLEIVTPERYFAPDVGGLNHVPYARCFQAHGVRITIARRLRGVRRDGNRLAAEVGSDYGETTETRRVDQVVVEHGTLPLDELYFALKERSSNRGEVDYQALIAGRPQAVAGNPDGHFQLFRIGDAVASRNIHAAIYDALRLCKDL